RIADCTVGVWGRTIEPRSAALAERTPPDLGGSAVYYCRVCERSFVLGCPWHSGAVFHFGLGWHRSAQNRAVVQNAAVNAALGNVSVLTTTTSVDIDPGLLSILRAVWRDRMTIATSSDGQSSFMKVADMIRKSAAVPTDDDEAEEEDGLKPGACFEFLAGW